MLHRAEDVPRKVGSMRCPVVVDRLLLVSVFLAQRCEGVFEVGRGLDGPWAGLRCGGDGPPPPFFVCLRVGLVGILGAIRWRI